MICSLTGVLQLVNSNERADLMDPLALLYETFGLIEDGDEAFVGGDGFLKKTGEFEVEHVLTDAVVFPGGKLAVQTGDGYAVIGNILAHEADRDAFRQVFFDPGQQLAAFAGEPG